MTHPPEGDWSETTGEHRDRMRRIEDALMRLSESRANGSRHLGSKEWIAILSIVLASVGMAGGVATQLFRGRADGEVADAKFEDHVHVQVQFESDVRTGIREIKTELKDVSRKLERMETKNRR